MKKLILLLLGILLMSGCHRVLNGSGKVCEDLILVKRYDRYDNPTGSVNKFSYLVAYLTADGSFQTSVIRFNSSKVDEMLLLRQLEKYRTYSISSIGKSEDSLTTISIDFSTMKVVGSRTVSLSDLMDEVHRKAAIEKDRKKWKRSESLRSLTSTIMNNLEYVTIVIAVILLGIILYVTVSYHEKIKMRKSKSKTQVIQPDKDKAIKDSLSKMGYSNKSITESIRETDDILNKSL